MSLPVASVRASRAPRGWALLPWAALPAVLAIVARWGAIAAMEETALWPTPAELAA